MQSPEGGPLNSALILVSPQSKLTQGEELPLEDSLLPSNFDPEPFVSSPGSSCSSGDDSCPGPPSPDPSSSSSSSSGSEEDLDFLDEDEASESESLFDASFLKFRHILDARVDDAERFFDRGLRRVMTGVDVASQTEEEESGPLNVPVSNSLSVPRCRGVETQTDSAPTSTGDAAAAARGEISKLRDAREPLNQERKGLTERLKGVKKVTGLNYAVLWEEKQLYELEEAIEAIDLAIEFKNEIICGHETILQDKLAPGQERAELVTRLSSLSLLDLQRLFCKFFVKVVEFRYCTKKLERNVDKLEGEREKMRRQISIHKKFLKEKDEEHENRIKLLLRQYAKVPGGGGGGGTGEVLWMTQELSKAKRKLLDFQLALTELLVLHGYLIDGADYDVKHVVRMLGLDFGELRQLEAASGPSHGATSTQRAQPRRNLNQRRNAEPENAVPSFHLHSASSRTRQGEGSRQNEPSSRHQSHGHTPSEGYRDRDRDRDRGYARERSRETRHRDRGHSSRQHQASGSSHAAQVHGHHHQGHQEEGGHTEVRRLKKKLIIQPNTSQ